MATQRYNFLRKACPLLDRLFLYHCIDFITLFYFLKTMETKITETQFQIICQLSMTRCSLSHSDHFSDEYLSPSDIAEIKLKRMKAKVNTYELALKEFLANFQPVQK